jgi:hypothetical protein
LIESASVFLETSAVLLMAKIPNKTLMVRIAAKPALILTPIFQFSVCMNRPLSVVSLGQSAGAGSQTIGSLAMES